MTRTLFTTASHRSCGHSGPAGTQHRGNHRPQHDHSNHSRTTEGDER